MVLVLQIVANVVVLLLSAIQIAMLLRAILSWFPIDSNRFIDFLYGVTEPFIYPFRVLFHRLNWFQDMPLDMAFMAANLTLILLLFIL
ncbi:MAG: YggT family protein [Clostridia bacterium]|nr:YggT family protein [Clostridia bacterium]